MNPFSLTALFGLLALSFALTLEVSSAQPSPPEDAPSAPAGSEDPFGPPPKHMPPLTCAKRSDLEAALRAAGASPLVRLTQPAEMFYRGFFSAQDFTPPGYPVGERVEVSVRATEDKEGKAHLEGVIVFALGDVLVCNKLAVAEVLLDQIWRAGGLASKETY